MRCGARWRPLLKGHEVKAHESVNVGGFAVYAGDRESLVRNIAAAPERPTIAYALHIGGLNLQRDASYRRVMNSSTYTYADGAAVSVLGRIAGAKDIQRAPTTDIGWHVMQSFAATTGKMPRVALIGGEPGEAARAGAALEDAGAAHTVFTWHGFERDYRNVLATLDERDVDILFVGMGMPLEAFWVERSVTASSARIVMTCGGWFGFLTQDEKRAPGFLQCAGLEWTWRLAQDPARLWRRYLVGAYTTLIVLIQTLRRNVQHGHRRR